MGFLGSQKEGGKPEVGGRRSKSVAAVLAVFVTLTVLCVSRAGASSSQDSISEQHHTELHGRIPRSADRRDSALQPVSLTLVSQRELRAHRRHRYKQRRRKSSTASTHNATAAGRNQGRRGSSSPASRKHWALDVDSSSDASRSGKVPTECDVSALASLGNRTHVESQAETEAVLCQYFLPWSAWRSCGRRCTTSRVRRCRDKCHGVPKLKETKPCRRKRGRGRCSSKARARATKDSHRKRNRLIQRVLYDVLYTQWTRWGFCSRSCKQRRRKRCLVTDVCQNSFVQVTRRCSVPGTKCEKRFGSKPTPSPTPSPSPVTPRPTTTTPRPRAVTTARPARPDTMEDDEDNEQEEDEELSGEGDNDDKGDVLDEVLTALRGQQCGVRPPATRGSYRVVGGQEAQKYSWPWQTAIMSRWEEQYCGGTLIAPQWLLTAAHCVRKKNRRRHIIVRTGEHDLEEYDESEDDHRPEKEFPHPDFDYATITNDIALVRLKKPVAAKSHPGYACLPEPDFSPDRGSLCYILGWGKKRNTHLFGAEKLHEVEVPLVSHKKCQKAFEYDIDLATQTCAGYRRGGKDACAGDSGGPLLCPRTEAGVTSWFLTGITSYGEGCGRKGKFGIYTNVSSYRQWIADTIRLY